MTAHTLTAGTISAVAGIVLSLAFSYVPKLKDWFEAQPGTTKRLVVLGSLAAAAGGAVAISCTPIIVPGAICTQSTIVDGVTAFIAAMVANQSTYSFAPQPKA